MLAKVNEIVNLYIRPKLNEHGGDIEVLCIKDNIVRIRLTGNCSGCLAASLTVEEIVKSELVGHIPDIKDVEVDTQVNQDLIEFARKILNKNDEDK
jgi:Fe-S cluster biogenesis protein NfuA